MLATGLLGVAEGQVGTLEKLDGATGRRREIDEARPGTHRDCVATHGEWHREDVQDGRRGFTP